AVLAQDVLAHGLRMFPELNGAPYYNKPALLAWLIALVSWPAGSVSQLTAALPSAAAAVALAFVVWSLGRDMFGADAGWYAALVAVATQGFFLQARLPLPDMLMTLFITLALWQLWRMTRDGARGHHWLGFYGATALAFWSKGGAGFLPLAVALGWAVVNARDAGWRRLGLLRGLALLVLLIAPWWLFGLRTDRVAIRGAVVDNQLFWYLPFTLTLNSVTAPLRNAFGILFPWVLVVPLVLVQAVRCARGEDADRRDVGALLLALGWGMRRARMGGAFAVAWLGSAVFVAGAYHWEVDRFNAANDFPRVSERMRPALQGASVVATWGVPELPLSFYFHRRV